MFRINHVSKQYNNEFVLQDVSMEIGIGLNFIVGASGSGKTTLLKILSGMESEYEGEVFYFDKNIKELEEKEKGYYYKNIFGFIWQEFHLLEDLTVIENVMLSQYLEKEASSKAAVQLLKKLKIYDLANQKVKNLSGGQKQRVAIARELIKNPQVLIADEPTSALDLETVKIVMDILKEVSKSIIVIVVTHDTSLIHKNSKVYELDKGELFCQESVTSIKNIEKNKKLEQKKEHRLTCKNACILAFKNLKSKVGRSIISMVSIVISSILLLVMVSGAISKNGQSVFDELFDTYGKSILDISIVQSFMGAGGTSGVEDDEPNVDVSQDIDGLYETYELDKRVDYMTSLQAFENIKITMEGKTYEIESSGSVPQLNELTSGNMPVGAEKQVVVSQSFVKKIGLSEEQILGKNIVFQGSIYNWESGEPVLKEVSADVTVVGVADTSVVYEYNNQIETYSVDDSFFFSKLVIDDIRKQAEIKNKSANFCIRAKTPEDMIAIKEELNAIGIVPLGRFELVEDVVWLNQQTTQQSNIAVSMIGVFSIVLVSVISFVTAFLRKREYAIYKITGYTKKQLTLLTYAESFVSAIGAILLFFISAPFLNRITISLWNTTILKVDLLLIGSILLFIISILTGSIMILIGSRARTADFLKTECR